MHCCHYATSRPSGKVTPYFTLVLLRMDQDFWFHPWEHFSQLQRDLVPVLSRTSILCPHSQSVRKTVIGAYIILFCTTFWMLIRNHCAAAIQQKLCFYLMNYRSEAIKQYFREWSINILPLVQVHNKAWWNLWPLASVLAVRALRLIQLPQSYWLCISLYHLNGLVAWVIARVGDGYVFKFGLHFS